MVNKAHNFLPIKTLSLRTFYSLHLEFCFAFFFQGKWCENVFKKNQEIMANLWNEIADLADFNKVEFH